MQIAPKCNLIENEIHLLQSILVNKENIELNTNLDKCTLCSSKIEIGNTSYYCTSCKHSLCHKCCDLIICDKTPLRLNIPRLIKSIEQTTKTSIEIIFANVTNEAHKELEYKLETKITNCTTKQK